MPKCVDGIFGHCMLQQHLSKISKMEVCICVHHAKSGLTAYKKKRSSINGPYDLLVNLGFLNLKHVGSLSQHIHKLKSLALLL